MNVIIVTATSAMLPASRIESLFISYPQNARKLSAKPIKYKLTLKDNPTNNARPKVPPIESLKLRLIM